MSEFEQARLNSALLHVKKMIKIKSSFVKGVFSHVRVQWMVVNRVLYAS